jgi:hypothetical protein
MIRLQPVLGPIKPLQRLSGLYRPDQHLGCIQLPQRYLIVGMLTPRR